MSDLLLGMIIGGLIGVGGSALTAWIQGNYLLKAKREENLTRQQEQLTQIRHEKNTELIHRIIEVRTRYLDPLSTHLVKLQTSTSDFSEKLLDVTVRYLPKQSEISKEHKIKVDATKKLELLQQLKWVDDILSAIETSQTRIQEASIKATDINLRGLLGELVLKVYSLREAYYKMKVDLAESTTGHDFTYDFGQILKPITDVQVSIGHTNGRIESLLAGADAGDE